MQATPQHCAHEVLEVVPTIMQEIRYQMRAQRQHDLSVPQFRVLAFLNDWPGSSLSAVADHIGLTLPSMSILVNGLVERELIERLTSKDDRRRVTLTLTPDGRQLYERTRQGAEASIAALFAMLSESNRLAVLQAMQVMRPLFLNAAVPAQA